MKALIVGLGNVGDKYSRSRHNVGFMVLDNLAFVNKLSFEAFKKDIAQIATSDGLLLAKPKRFMNSSGIAVKKLLDYYSITPSVLYIVHDDLDMPIGEHKIQFAKGPKVHGGINSIEDHLKSKDFWRVRIGVDNRDPENRIKGEEYVLQNFNNEEMLLIESVIIKATKELLSLVK